MIASRRPFLLVAAFLTACNDPTGVLKDAPQEPAFARGLSPIGGELLPTLGGPFSEARAVNDAGIVVGFSTDNAGVLYAVRWTRAGTASWSISPIAGPDSRAFAISGNGVAVGVRAGNAKLWPATGGEIDLGPGHPGGINSAESIVGYRIDPVFRETAVVWSRPITGWDLAAGNASRDLPLFPGGTRQSQAFAINDAGIIAGSVGVSTATSSYYAVRWDPVGDQWAEPAALAGAESFSSTTGRAINDNPQPDFAGHVRACQQICSAFGIFWPGGGSPTSLEPFFGGGSGWVEGINNAQRTVGFRFDPRRGNRAFVWSPGQTSVQQLAGPQGYSNTQAYDINNAIPAQAVGYGQKGSSSVAIVWTIP